MTDKDFDNEVPGGEDPEAQASGSDPQVGRNDDNAGDGSVPGDFDGDDLTVDDILGTDQNIDAAAEDAVLADLESQLLGDLKRLQAEYANYRRRTEDQREIEIARAKGSVAKGLLPVLDDLDRAAKQLRGVAERMGLETYGAAGEVFDPQQHEAIFQAPTPGATEATILEVVEIGYRLGSVELRPAKVVVAVPAE